MRRGLTRANASGGSSRFSVASPNRGLPPRRNLSQPRQGGAHIPSDRFRVTEVGSPPHPWPPSSPGHTLNRGRSDRSSGKLNDQLDIVRTGGVVERCPVPSSLSAAPAAADDDPPLLTAILHTDRLEQTSARVGPVSRKVVDMLREEAIGTVVTAATVHEGRHLAPTVEAGKALVCPLGCKAPHSPIPRIILPCRLPGLPGSDLECCALEAKARLPGGRGQAKHSRSADPLAKGGPAGAGFMPQRLTDSRTPPALIEGGLRWST